LPKAEEAMARASVLWIVAALALAACSRDFIYQPTVNTSAQIAGRVAADYPVPSAPG